MVKRTAKFIHKLRVFFLFFISFCFLLLLGLNPVDLGKIIKGKAIQAVGISVGVPENQYNKLAIQLSEKEEKLNEREENLAALEANLLDTYNQRRQNKIMIFMAIGIFVLFVLVLTNFYLDYRRKIHRRLP